MRVAIIGAGELGKLAAYHATIDSGFEVTGFYDDFNESGEFAGRPIFGKVSDVEGGYARGSFDNIFIAIGYAQMKARSLYYERFKGQIPLANIIHSSSYVDPSCSLGEGIFLLPGCTLDFESQLSDNVLLNTGVTVAHHSRIEANSFVGPGVTIAGLVEINECSFIGIGATVLDCIKIGRNSTVGGGAVVTKDTEDNSISVGIPARPIRYKDGLC